MQPSNWLQYRVRDRGDLPWTAEDGKMQSLAVGSPRCQNGEADRDRYSLNWTVPLHTVSVDQCWYQTSAWLEHSDTFWSKKC